MLRNGLTMDHLSRCLGVEPWIIQSWLDGKRRPRGAVRHHIWLVSSLLDGTAPRNLFELSTWNRFRDWEAEEREAREQEQAPEPPATGSGS